VLAETILNQERVVRFVEDQLEFSGSAGLMGRPGAGKSHTSRKIADHWISSGGLVAYVLGDQNQQHRRYLPFQHAVEQFGMIRSLATRGAMGVATKAVGAIPYAGPIASFVLDFIFNSKKEHAAERASYLSKEEQTILYHLQRASTGQRMLFVCDDIQAWDEASVSFLKMLLSKRLNGTYPFLKNVAFLLIKTTEKNPDDANDDLTATLGCSVPVYFLDYVQEAEFSSVLSMFGSPAELEPDRIALLFGICGGHLHVAKQLAEYLASATMGLDKFTSEDSRSLVMKMVKERLRPLGQHGEDLLGLLTVASTIGCMFMDNELACLSKQSDRDMRALLQRAMEMQLIRRSAKTSQFAHGIIQDCLQSLGKRNADEQHRQFATCLRDLRPGDYHMRSYHLLQAGERLEAAIFAICAILQERRDLSRLPPSISNLELIREQGLGGIFDQLEQATDWLARYELDKALKCADSVAPTAPAILRAEATYICAMCLIKKYSYTARTAAISRVERTLVLVSDELEIEVRLRSTQLVALANQRMTDAAFAAQELIVRILSKRISFDPDAEDALRILDRKADLLYAADQSIGQLLKAKQHFMPEGDGQPRNFFQYCAATMNVAANRISCSEYAEALSHLREITLFLNANPELVFPRPEVLMNNLIVAELLGGICNAQIASSLFKPLVDKHIATLDHVFLQSNYGAALALAGDLAAAEEVLSDTYDAARSNSDIDHLHLYLAGSNLAAVRFLSGDQAGAAVIFDTLNTVLEEVYPAHTVYFKHRHVMFGRIIAEGNYLLPEQWHGLALVRDPDGPGPSWRHYGQGFLFTDIQIWTES
jgi:tetratricopeptide (TPR) repeat protein